MKTLKEKVNDLENQFAARWNSKMAAEEQLEKQLLKEKETSESLQKQVNSLEAKVGEKEKMFFSLFQTLTLLLSSHSYSC